MSSLGYKHSEEAKKRIGKSSSVRQFGENNPAWKGDNAKYQAKHIAIRKKFGKASVCENRNEKVLNFICNEKSKIFNWAKKKDRDYTRNKEDYYQLCAGCHLTYDRYYEKI